MSIIVPREEWLAHRRDGTQQARARGQGQIRAPHVSWKHFVGQIETTLLLTPTLGAETLILAPDSTLAPCSALDDPRWGLAPPSVCVRGACVPVENTVTSTYAEALPDLPGPIKFEFESGFDIPTVNGQWQDSIGRCYVWREGCWSLLWETEPIFKLFQPLPLVGDFDRDGQLEVAILPWSELLILDARTGRLKDRCAFTKERSYGFFAVYNMPGSATSVFVVQSDLSKHVDVLGYHEGRLALLWQHNIELDVSNPEFMLHVHPRPVADVDGDGRMELLINEHNTTGEHRWLLNVHDALSGEPKYVLPDEYVQGVLDVNGDGAAELLTTRYAGTGLPGFGRIAAYGFSGGRAAPLWQAENAAWGTWEPPLPRHVNTKATLAKRNALCRETAGRASAVIVRPARQGDGLVELSAAAWGAQGFEPGMAVTGPGLEALALDAQGQLLVRCRKAPGQRVELAIHAARAQVLGASENRVKPGSVALAWEQGAQAPCLAAQGSADELVFFAPPSDGAAHERRIAGRGQGINAPVSQLGPVLADLYGDGRRQMLYVTSSLSGDARFVAAHLNGRELWHHDLARIPGSPPIWNLGGAVLWQVGHLASRRRVDVLVTVRRSLTHSEETLLLCGEDGRELWRRVRQPSIYHSRGVGGTPFAIADFDGDGLEEAGSFYPSLCYILKGTTGENLLCRDSNWEGVPARPVYWGVPVAVKIETEDRPSLLFATQRAAMTGRVSAEGDLVWWDALDTSPKQLPAVGDFDGDGRLELLGIGYADGARCYDVATGALRWRLAIEAGARPAGSGGGIPRFTPDGVAAGTASGDLDGDGRDEALFTLGPTLYCLGSNASGDAGELRWQMSLPARLGPPSIADVDGSGQLAVLVMGEDGYVYCVR